MKRKKIKRKQSALYLLTSDIKELNSRYSLLYRDVKNDTNLSEEQIKEACEILLEKYKFEVVELSKRREAEYWEEQAKIEAKNNARIPWRRSCLWRLIFQPVTNRAQDIIEEQAELEAEKYFRCKENELDDLAKKLYAEEEQGGETLSETQTESADVVDVQSGAEKQQLDVDVTEPPEPPARIPRKAKQPRV